MGFVASVNFFIALFYDTARRLIVWRIWLILLLYFLLQWFVLYAHYKFYSPFFFGIIEPWTRYINPQSAMGFIHYPGQFLMLPYFFGLARFLLAIPIEGPLLGAVAVLIYRSYDGRWYPRPDSAGRMFYLWGQLVMAWFVVDGLMMLINTYLPEFLSSALYLSPRRILVFWYMFLPGLHIFLLSVFYLVIAYAAVLQVSFFRAVRLSLRCFLLRPLTCIMLAAVILIVPVIIGAVLHNASAVLERFRPEAVYLILLAGLAADAVIRFVWMGTAVRFILGQED